MGAKLPTKLVSPQILPKASAPTSADLRAYAVPVGDQDPLGACTAWAVAYAMMGWYAQRGGMNARAFAPMYMYSQISGGVDGGALSTDAFDLAVNQGIDTQADYMPQGNYNYWSQPTSAQRTNAAKSKFTGFTTLFAGQTGVGSASRPLIEGAISSSQPVAVAFAVRAGFANLASVSDLSRMDDDYTTGVIGYHEVLALAYDDDGLIIQNSWGPDWGAGGYAKLSWDVVAHDVFEADVATGYVAQPSVPVVSVTLPQWEVPTFGASSSIQVPSNTAWQVTSVPSWVTVTPASGFGLVTTGPTGGRGNVPLTLTVDPNPATSERSGAVTFTTTSGSPQAVATVAIHQQAVGYDDCGASVASHCDWPDLATSTSGAIDFAGDTDWFTFSPRTSGDWTIVGSTPSEKSTDYARGTVLGADGVTVLATDYVDDPASMLYFTLHATLQAGATYFLKVEGKGGTPGNYTLSALTPTLNPSLALPSEGWMIFGDDAQTFRDFVVSNTTWAATTDVPWLHVTPTTAFSNATIVIVADKNPSGAPRTGTITITTTSASPIRRMTEEVHQSVQPTMSVDRSTWTVPSASAQSISAQVSSNYYWSAQSDSTWLSVSPNNGLQDAAVTISATTNTTGGLRNAVLTFTTQPWIPEKATWTVTVSQPGVAQAPPSLSLSQTSWSMGSSNPGTDVVQVSSNASWSASANVSWVTVTPSDGTGDAQVQVIVDGNTSSVGRDGTVTFTTRPLTNSGPTATATFTVHQPGMSAGGISVDQSQWQLSSAASANTFVVVSTPASWTAHTDAAWITASPGSGTGGQSVMLTASANTGGDRVGTVTFQTTTSPVASATVTVTQPGTTSAPSLVLSLSSWVLASSASETNRIQVSSDTSWSVTSNQAWLTVSPDTSAGSGTLVLSASANPGSAPRMCVVTVKTTAGYPAVWRTVSVAQPGAPGGPTLSVGMSAWVVPSSAASLVSTTVSSSTSWSVSSNQSWLSVIPSSGTGNQSVMFVAAANPGTASRSGALTFTTTSGSPAVSVVVSVTQPGGSGGPTLSVGMSAWVVPSAAASLVSTTVSSSTSWSVSSNQSWLSVIPSSGTGNQSVMVVAAANPGTASRSGALTFTTTSGSPAVSVVVPVTQPGP